MSPLDATIAPESVDSHTAASSDQEKNKAFPTHPEPSPASPSPPTLPKDDDRVHLGPRVIAGIAVGGAAALVTIAILAWLLMRRRRSRRSTPSEHFEIDESAVVTPHTGLHHSNASRIALHHTPSAPKSPSRGTGFQPVPCHAPDIYVSDVDAGPVQPTPNVHVLPPQYDPQWNPARVEMLHSGGPITPYSDTSSASGSGHAGSLPTSTTTLKS